MYISHDRALTLEECGVVTAKERILAAEESQRTAASAAENDGKRPLYVSPQKILQNQRRVNEIGVSATSRRTRKSAPILNSATRSKGLRGLSV